MVRALLKRPLRDHASSLTEEGLSDGGDDGLNGKGFGQKLQPPLANIRQVFITGIPAHENERELRVHGSPALG